MSQSDAYTDVVELCALLQCLGFSVKSLDSSDGNMSQDGGSRTVVINCQASGLHVVLESPSASCSCPDPSQQNSGLWQVSGVAGGKQLDKEFGWTLLGSLPKSHRERLTKELREMIRCIKEHNDSEVEKLAKEDNKSASMTELKTPEKLLSAIKAETPTRYRSLDTLTAAAAKDSQQRLPTPGALQRAHLVSEGDCGSSEKKTRMCHRQSTYTLSSGSSSIRRRNKTSSPIHMPHNTVLESLIDAEKAAKDLHNKLIFVIQELHEEGKDDDSSMSSLTLDVSKISVLKASETTKAQFVSSPNLSAISASDNFTKSQQKRYDSASTSNLATKEGKMSRLRRISPNIFSLKKGSPSVKVDKVKTQDSKSKLNCLFKPKIITPVRTPKSIQSPQPSPNLSTASKKKYGHIKSTIPRPAKKD